MTGTINKGRTIDFFYQFISDYLFITCEAWLSLK
jgi:hypothetical protein